MVLSRFFQRQQSVNSASSKEADGLGGADDILDEVRPDTRRSTSYRQNHDDPNNHNTDDIVDLFRKKKKNTKLIVSNNDDDDSSDNDDKINNSAITNENENDDDDDQATFVTKDSDIHSIDRQQLSLCGGDDMTVDTMNTKEIQQQIVHDFLNEFQINNHPTATIISDTTTTKTMTTTTNTTGRTKNPSVQSDNDGESSDLEREDVDKNTTTTTITKNQSKLQSAAKKASWTTAWFTNSKSTEPVNNNHDLNGNNENDDTESNEMGRDTSIVNDATNNNNNDNSDDSDDSDVDMVHEPVVAAERLPSTTTVESGASGNDNDRNANTPSTTTGTTSIGTTAAVTGTTTKKSGWGWKTASIAIIATSSTSQEVTKSPPPPALETSLLSTTNDRTINNDNDNDNSVDSDADVVHEPVEITSSTTTETITDTAEGLPSTTTVESGASGNDNDRNANTPSTTTGTTSIGTTAAVTGTTPKKSGWGWKTASIAIIATSSSSQEVTKSPPPPALETSLLSTANDGTINNDDSDDPDVDKIDEPALLEIASSTTTAVTTAAAEGLPSTTTVEIGASGSNNDRNASTSTGTTNTTTPAAVTETAPKKSGWGWKTASIAIIATSSTSQEATKSPPPPVSPALETGLLSTNKDSHNKNDDDDDDDESDDDSCVNRFHAKSSNSRDGIIENLDEQILKNATTVTTNTPILSTSSSHSRASTMLSFFTSNKNNATTSLNFDEKEKSKTDGNLGQNDNTKYSSESDEDVDGIDNSESDPGKLNHGDDDDSSGSDSDSDSDSDGNDDDDDDDNSEKGETTPEGKNILDINDEKCQPIINNDEYSCNDDDNDSRRCDEDKNSEDDNIDNNDENEFSNGNENDGESVNWKVDNTFYLEHPKSLSGTNSSVENTEPFCSQPVLGRSDHRRRYNNGNDVGRTKNNCDGGMSESSSTELECNEFDNVVATPIVSTSYAKISNIPIANDSSERPGDAMYDGQDSTSSDESDAPARTDMSNENSNSCDDGNDSGIVARDIIESAPFYEETTHNKTFDIKSTDANSVSERDRMSTLHSLIGIVADTSHLINAACDDEDFRGELIDARRNEADPQARLVLNRECSDTNLNSSNGSDSNGSDGESANDAIAINCNAVVDSEASEGNEDSSNNELTEHVKESIKISLTDNQINGSHSASNDSIDQGTFGSDSKNAGRKGHLIDNQLEGDSVFVSNLSMTSTSRGNQLESKDKMSPNKKDLSIESDLGDDVSSSSSASDNSIEKTKQILEVWKETVESSKSRKEESDGRTTSFSDNDSYDPPPDDNNLEDHNGGKVPKRVWGWFAVKKKAQEIAKKENEKLSTTNISDNSSKLGQSKATDYISNKIDINEDESSPTTSRKIVKIDVDKHPDSNIPALVAAGSPQIKGSDRSPDLDDSGCDADTDCESEINPSKLVLKEEPLHRHENANAETEEKMIDDQGQKKDRSWWFGKKNSFEEKADDPKISVKDEIQVDSNHTLEKSSNHSIESVTEPLLDVLMMHEDLERASKDSPLTKQTKKKKSADITNLLKSGISTGKVGRHGDEVSVGAMNAKKWKNGHAVIISGSIGDIDEEDDFGPRSRPWEGSLKKIPKRSHKLMLTKQKNPPVDYFNSFPSELEDLLKRDGFGNTDDFLHQRKVSETTNRHLPSLHEEDESDRNDHAQTQDEDDIINKIEESLVEDVGSIDNILEMKDLEKQLYEMDTAVPQVLDFEDMWDNVSCDASTAIEFDRLKRKKHHEKEKKRQRREQEKDDKVNSARRLRLFERRKEKEQSSTYDGSNKRTVDKPSKLSDELVDAIHKVFDDGSVNSAASSLDHSKDGADRFDDQSANGSCNSLYLPGDESDKVDHDNDSNDESTGSINQFSKQENVPRKKFSDDATDDGMNTIQGSRIHESKKSKKGKKQSRHPEQANKSATNYRSKRAKKSTARSEIDSSEIFLAEVERLKRPKVLTIAALKQEMIDRRGTSVNLVKKEYVNYRKKRNDRRKGLVDNELKPIDFGALSEQIKKKQDDPKNDIFGKPSSDSRDDSESTSKHQRGGLGAKLSRWKATEGITDLDDLATVMETPVPNTSLLNTAAVFAKAAVSQLPDVSPAINDLQNIARDAGKTITTVGTTAVTVGQTVGGTAVKAGERAGRAVGTGLSHGAQTVNTSIQASTEVFGKGLNTVSNSLSTLVPTSSSEVQQELTMDDFHSLQGSKSKGDDNFMFAASFSDLHLTTIQEGDDDDDDDHGLLASHNKNRNHDAYSFDGESFRDDDDNDDNGSLGLREGKRNFKMGKIKAPKLGLNIKKLVPKMPKRKSDSIRGGFLMGGGGGGNNGYGGMG